MVIIILNAVKIPFADRLLRAGLNQHLRCAYDSKQHVSCLPSEPRPLFAVDLTRVSVFNRSLS